MDYNKITFNYFTTEYSITDEMILFTTGSTNDNTTFEVNSAGTYFECDANFITSSQTNDNILIRIYEDPNHSIIYSGLVDEDAYLNYYTSIEEINGSEIKIQGGIPFSIFNDLNENGYSFIIKNIHYSEPGLDNFADYINASPFRNVIEAEVVDGVIDLQTKADYKYFDYNLLTITYERAGQIDDLSFNTNNRYSGYELDTFLNDVFDPYQPPTNLYNENSICGGITETLTEYYIEEIYDTTNNHEYGYPGSGVYSGMWYPVQSSRYKITPKENFKYKLKNFRPYTYLDFGNLTKVNDTYTYDYYDRDNLEQSAVTYHMNKTPYEITNSSRTMITEVGDDYMIIEKPGIDETPLGLTGGTGTINGIVGIYDFINVSKISDISDILMRVYINKNYHSYIKKSDSERNRIYGSYGQILTQNELIRNNATGIIYQDRNDLFNLDIFNINVDENFNFDDPNLLFQPIELLDLGVDKKTKPAKPINIENLDIKNTIDTWFISGNTTNYSNLLDENSYIWDTIVKDDTIYALIEWFDVIEINGIIYNTTGGTDTQQDNNRSLMLLEIVNGEIINNNQIYYEWIVSEHRIDNIQMRFDENKLSILITHFDNRNEKKVIIKPINILKTTDSNNNGSDLLVYDTSASTWNVTQYSADTSITLTDIVYDDKHNKYMLGRYYVETVDINVDGIILDNENDYSTILTKTNSGGTVEWSRTILQLNGNAITGPIVSELEIDDKDNLYLFGLITNYDGYTDIQVGDFSPINNVISKSNHENWLLLSKFNSDGTTLWNTLFKGSDNSLLLDTKIKYDEDSIYFSFNFSESVELNSAVTYTTKNAQTINSVIGKVDRLTGELLFSKRLKSTINNILNDFTLDENYIYSICEFKGEAMLDNYNIFSNGENGYILKIRKSDGVFINLREVFCDGKLVLDKINNDVENIIVFGSWSGNIYIDSNIKYSENEDFFITNIKKNDI